MQYISQLYIVQVEKNAAPGSINSQIYSFYTRGCRKERKEIKILYCAICQSSKNAEILKKSIFSDTLEKI